MSDRVKLACEIAARTIQREFRRMRTMCVFSFLILAITGAAHATSSSSNHKGTVDYNGVKDRYDCIHLGGVWHPLMHRCTKTV